MAKSPQIPVKEEFESCNLPTGYALYWRKNEAGGRTYVSDEVGGGTFVWDTCLVDSSTLIAAIHKENELRIKEHYENEAAKRANLAESSDDVPSEPRNDV